MKQLEDSQLETFDTEYVNDKRWTIVKEQIDQDFPDGDFTFLDVGGGNGLFADRLLTNYPKCRGTVLDNSELLLNRNTYNSRKTLICDSVENLGNLNNKYDIVSLNWLLHHLVGSSYAQSRQNIDITLQTAISLLTERGRISIFDNMYNGLLVDGLPSFIIYHLTSAKAISSFTSKMGANTAGVGVCFLSKQQWISTFERNCSRIINYSDAGEPWFTTLSRKFFLHMGKVHEGHFWLSI
jgi:Methyltransferase domain